MNPYLNEDVMWQRLKDIQREAENRRLYGDTTLNSLLGLLGTLGTRVWLAGLAMRRPPRRRPIHLVDDDSDSASDAA